MAQKTEAARELAADKKRAIALLTKERKKKVHKKEASEVARLQAENAQLCRRIATLEKRTGAFKQLDDYRMKMYNEMVDTFVEIKRNSRAGVFENPEQFSAKEISRKVSVRTVRPFMERNMRNFARLVRSRYREE